MSSEPDFPELDVQGPQSEEFRVVWAREPAQAAEIANIAQYETLRTSWCFQRYAGSRFGRLSTDVSTRNGRDTPY